MKSMGYIIDDAEEVYNIIAESAKKEFLKGKYELGVLNRYGQRVSIAVELAGKREYLDRVCVLTDEYEQYGIHKGDEGHILAAEIRRGTFLFYREDPKTLADDLSASIKIEDLEVIESSDVTDEDILEELPLHNPEWGCKVEDGYILNLKGERLNKYAYNYTIPA